MRRREQQRARGAGGDDDPFRRHLQPEPVRVVGGDRLAQRIDAEGRRVPGQAANDRFPRGFLHRRRRGEIRLTDAEVND